MVLFHTHPSVLVVLHKLGHEFFQEVSISLVFVDYALGTLSGLPQKRVCFITGYNRLHVREREKLEHVVVSHSLVYFTDVAETYFVADARLVCFPGE